MSLSFANCPIFRWLSTQPTDSLFGCRVIGLLLVCLTNIWQPVSGQSIADSPIPAASLATDNLDLRPFTYVWVDTLASGQFPPVDYRRMVPFPSAPFRALGNRPTVWLRFRLRNDHPTDTLRRLFFGGYLVAWTLGVSTQEGRPISQRPNGWLVRHVDTDPFTLPISVLPGQTVTGWFQTTGYIFISALTPRLFTPVGYKRFRQARLLNQRNHFGYSCLIMGICLFLSLFAAVQAVYARDAVYGYWSFYLMATFLFFLLIADLGFNLQIVGPTIAALMIPSQYLIQMAYLLFLGAFLKLHQYIPPLHRLIRWVVFGLGIVCGLSFWASLNRVIPIIKFTDQILFLTDVLLLFLFVRVSRAKVPNRSLFITGSLGVLVSAAAGALVNELGYTDFDRFFFDPGVWFSFGVLFELVFFNLALSQRARLAEIEKQQLEHDRLVEQQRIQLITEQFQQRIAQTEIAALRSQMNPHFIFNCLNSIQFFTAQNHAEKASDYLTKFSRLIRLVLENSKSEKVTLTNELETLRLYIELEAMRFPDKLYYQILLADDVDADSIQLPPLLLQPYVENAIWHGLMHKDEGGTVTITVQQPQEDRLHIAITDDGVGRQQAAEYKSKSATQRKSFGMKLTADRIELINQLYYTRTQIDVVDLTDGQGRPKGTTVHIDIPI